MKLTVALAGTVALSAVVFALRHRELQALGSEAGVLHLNLLTPSATSSPGKGGTFNPQPILDAMRGLRSQSAHSEAATWARWAKPGGLSTDELQTLCAAARREPSPPPGFLAAVAGGAAAALDGRDDTLAANFFADMPQDDPAVARELSFRLSDWIEKDPSGLSRWLMRILAEGTVQGSRRREYERLITQAAVMLAPVAQLPFIRSQAEEEQGELLGAGLRRLKSADDLRAFAAAVITWPTARPREYVLSATMDKLLEHGGFEAAAAWLDVLPDATPEQKNGARLTLAMRDPEAHEMSQRAAWILSQADPGAQPDLAARITGDWVSHDYNAAGAWLHENRAAVWFDAAASAFATHVAGTEPATAFDWTLAISDEGTRRIALQEVIHRWRQNDPTAAADYLQAASIPDDWKTEFANEASGPASPAPAK